MAGKAIILQQRVRLFPLRVAIPILVLCNIRPSSMQFRKLLLNKDGFRPVLIEINSPFQLVFCLTIWDKDGFRPVLIETNSPFQLVFCLTIWYNDIWRSHKYKNRREDLRCNNNNNNKCFICMAINELQYCKS